MNFLPNELDDINKFYEYEIVDSDNRIVTDMDLGTHTRIKGDDIKKTVNLSWHLTNEQFKLFSEWFENYKYDTFFMKFPDYTYPNIDREKYYCFSFQKSSISVKKRDVSGYEFAIVLDWWFRVPPIDKV